MELGERIAVLREEQALTQAELAEAARISPSTLSQIESGKVPRPHVGTVRKIARALGVEPAELRRAKEPAVPLADAPREAGPYQPHSAVGLEGERRGKEVLGQALTELAQWWLQTGPPTSRLEVGKHFGFLDSAFELQRVLDAWLEPRVANVENARNLSTAEQLAIGPVEDTAILLTRVMHQKLRQLKEYAKREDKPALLDELEQRRRKLADQQAILEKRTRSTG